MIETLIMRLARVLGSVSLTILASGQSGPAIPSASRTLTLNASTSTTLVAGQPVERQTVDIDVRTKVTDVSQGEFENFVLETLNDQRSWGRAGFSFRANPDAMFHVYLTEPSETDTLCLPLKTGGRVSCQNGRVVALNADRWRTAVAHWTASLTEYRQYLVNHEVGHLIGQFHPLGRCPIKGGRAALMEQQTKSLNGCIPNSWPLDWEIEIARARPVLLAPAPNVTGNVRNQGDDPNVTTTTTSTAPAASEGTISSSGGPAAVGAPSVGPVSTVDQTTPPVIDTKPRLSARQDSPKSDHKSVLLPLGCSAVAGLAAYAIANRRLRASKRRKQKADDLP